MYPYICSVICKRPLGSRFSVNRRLFSNGATVDAEEVQRFNRLAEDWWSENGPMKALRAMNRLRVPWIRDTLVRTASMRQTVHATRPLAGFQILDVGCGAGFLAEPLARLGATVVGLDASGDSIQVARAHAQNRTDLDYGTRLFYHEGTLESLQEKRADAIFLPEHFDAVVASEVLEHVASRETFVEHCLRLAKGNGGHLFFTTINRTLTARLLAISLAENVLRIVPPGMHEYEKFTSPDDLQFLLERENDCKVRMIHGMWYNPLTNTWRWTKNTSVSYAMHAVKE